MDPRDLNSRADLISMLIDLLTLMITNLTPSSLQNLHLHLHLSGLAKLWGSHSVDRFTCNYNAKLPRFNSRFFQPGFEAIDVFCQDWRFNNNWFCPRVCLMVRVMRHLELGHARRTLTVPLWKSSSFWNSCSKDGVY